MTLRTHNSNAPPLPRWFRAVLVIVATVIMCACRAPERVVQNAHPSLPPQAANAPYPVQQAAFVSQHFVDNCPTAPYTGPMGPPCACCDHGGCAACAPGAVVGPPDEYLCDGGDYGVQAGVRHDWSIAGLEQEDTITHYDTLDGRVIVQPSNRVCIYAPRFGAVRKVTTPVLSEQEQQLVAIVDDMHLNQAAKGQTPGTSLQRHMPIASLGDQPPSLYLGREQPIEFNTPLRVMTAADMVKPYCDFQIIKLGLHDNAEKPWLAKQSLAAHVWAGDQAAQVIIDGTAAQETKSVEQAEQMFMLDLPESPRIRLIKLASTNAAHPGEEVSFTLRFDNVGDQKIGNVTIVDHLNTRLEYVPDSAQASIDADFSTKPEGDGSTVLRWEITAPLAPGEGGILQFRAKVR